MRRASGKSGFGIWLTALLGFVGLAVASYFFLVGGTDSFRGLEKLDAVAYTESAKSFQGGTYFIEGELDEFLRTETGLGKLVSLGVSSSRGVILIPVLVPDSLQSFNLQKGQLLKLKVKGVEKGLLRAEKISKTP